MVGRICYAQRGLVGKPGSKEAGTCMKVFRTQEERLKVRPASLKANNAAYPMGILYDCITGKRKHHPTLCPNYRVAKSHD